MRFSAFAGWTSAQETTAACGIEAIALELQLHLRPHALQQPKKRSRKKIERRRRAVMRASFNYDAARLCRKHESRKNGLKHQGPASSRSHTEPVLARTNPARRKSQCNRAKK